MSSLSDRKNQIEYCTSLNSFRAKGNIEVFANNADTSESARDELTHLNLHCLSFSYHNSPKLLLHERWTPDFEHGRIYFKQFGAERVNPKH